jgi:hypothetical protein
MLHGAGSCVNENVCPAIVNVPVRAAPVVLGLTLKSTSAVPLYELPLEMVRNPAFETAPHPHPGAATTPAEVAPPPDGEVPEEARSE